MSRRLALAVLILSCRLAGARDLVRFAHLTNVDGLMTNDIHTFAEDSQGFLWIGTQGGLHRYDGLSVRVFLARAGEPNSLAEGWVQCLAARGSGELWIGTQSTGLDRLDLTTETFQHYRHDPDDPSSLSSDATQALLVDRAGHVWLGTEAAGLNRLDPETGTVVRHRHDPEDETSLSSDAVQALLEDRAQAIWIGTAGGGLERLDPATGRLTHFRHDPEDPASLASDDVLTLHEDRAGRLWIGTRGGGLDRHDPAAGSFVHHRHDPRDPSSLSSDDIMAVHDDPTGSIWVMTATDGLNRLDPTSGQVIRYRHDPDDAFTLASDVARESSGILEDRAGALWVATLLGAEHFDPQRPTFRTYRNDPDDPTSLDDRGGVFGIAEDQDGFVWLGTVGGGLKRFDPSKRTFEHHLHDPRDPSSISHGLISGVMVDRENTVWAAARYSGLNRFDRETGTFTHYHHDPEDPRSLSSDAVIAVYEDSSGQLWVGSHGGLDRLDRATGTFTHYAHDPADPSSLVANTVRVFLEGTDGRLWIGTRGGLSCLDRAREEFVSYVEGDDPHTLSNNRVLALLQDSAGAIWVGTDAGLNRLDPATGEIVRYTRFDDLENRVASGMVDDTIYELFEDGAGRLWMSTNAGIARLDPEAGTFVFYGLSDGVQDLEFNQPSGLRSRSGELYFGGPYGFNVFDPGRFGASDYVPPIAITSFKVFNEAPSLTRAATFLDEVVLTHDQNFFSFEFAALNFRRAERNRHAYRLEGLDPDWVHTGTRRYASYNSVPPGEYTFRVKGSNDDGVWNEEGAAVRIIVLPPFWQTSWFRGLEVLAVLGLLLAVDRTMRARMRRQAAERVHEESLRLAHDIQMAMLPTVFPHNSDFELAAEVKPAREVGGDLYDFHLDGGRLWFLVGDVSGKGMGAALFMAVTKTLFRATTQVETSPAVVLSRVNDELSRDNERAMFVTAFVGCLTLSTGEVQFANAGHNPPYLLRPGGSVESFGREHGAALGAMEGVEYVTGSLQLEPGDICYLYTDGVTEALSERQEQFSEERLEAALAKLTQTPATQVVRRTLAALQDFVLRAPQFDDITILALRYRP